MNIAKYLDATYLKTSKQAGITEEETNSIIKDLCEDAIKYNLKLVMVRANHLTTCRQILKDSSVLLGTVIDFPNGNSSINSKLQEAEDAMQLGADELDFVINYQAFKNGELKIIKDEVYQCTKLCIKHKKAVKWIIETAALTTKEIIVLSQLIRDTCVSHFNAASINSIFIKSSTGFYKTENNKPNGATLENMKLIIQNAQPLKAKAAGGVRNIEVAREMIKLGVDRIGISSYKIFFSKSK